MKKKLLSLIILLFFFVPLQTKAQEESIVLYLFHGEGCLHCKDEIEWLEETYLPNNLDIALEKYEVWYDQENRDLFARVTNYLDIDQTAVPFLVVGNQAIIGFSEEITIFEIEQAIAQAREKGFTDYVKAIFENNDITGPSTNETDEDKIFNLPFFSQVSVSEMSLPLVSIVLGFVDGFNPCAMWVLLLLISAIATMQDRKKMWLVGLTFIFVSGLTYLGFMLLWLNVALYINQLLLIRNLLGLLSIAYGVYIITKSYRKKEEDAGCEVTTQVQQERFRERLKNSLSKQHLLLMLIAVAGLAISVNAVELLCSLGIPVIFTQILSLSNLNVFQYIWYMFLYIFMYIIDDLIIFMIFMFTLKIKPISAKYEKVVGLVGGILMLILGILLIVKPEWVMLNF